MSAVRPIALVTGASSGIGLRSVLALARHGHHVVAAVRTLSTADELAAEVAATSAEVEIVQLDVRDRENIAAVVHGVEASHGAVDVLVNCAGIGSFGTVEGTSDAELALVMDTNFMSAVAMSRAALPAMRLRRSGVIVNIGSVDAWLPGGPFRWAYSASKHALGTFSEGLALEVEQFGIRVRQLDPGFYETRIRQNRLAREATTPHVGVDPYSDLRLAVDSLLVSGGQEAGDPDDVAVALIEAVQDPMPFPVRRLVGDSAREAVAAASGGQV